MTCMLLPLGWFRAAIFVFLETFLFHRRIKDVARRSSGATMDTASPMLPRVRQSQRVFLPLQLSTTTHVYLQRDAIKHHLTLAYGGPYPHQQDNYRFVDQVKPVHLDADCFSAEERGLWRGLEG